MTTPALAKDKIARFAEWLHVLEEDVICGEFGYEEGEFTVHPDLWHSSFDHGLSPQQAFRRALDMHACGRVEKECLQSINWARICYEDGRNP